MSHQSGPQQSLVSELYPTTLTAWVRRLGLLAMLVSAPLFSVACSPSFSQGLGPDARGNLVFNLRDELLIRMILRYGGTVALVSQRPDISQEIAGQWNSGAMTMLLYLNEVSSYEDYKEVIRHEAVHMAQFCHGRRQGMRGPIPLGVILSDAAKDSFNYGKDKGLYSPRQQILEAEAYTLEKASDQEVISILNFQCQDLNRNGL